MSDQYNLTRFLDAQQRDYVRALSEIRRGRKDTHWMWFVFPQFRGLGHSATSQLYAIGSVDEARAYLQHPVLGPRLIESADAVLSVAGRSARAIFGSPDDLKLRSCATLFAGVMPEHPNVFDRIIAKYFDGRGDEATLRLVGQTASDRSFVTPTATRSPDRPLPLSTRGRSTRRGPSAPARRRR